MKEDYSNYKVLIADDSRLVVNSVNLAIKQLGFHSDNIHLAYKPSEVIALCKSVDMDIIILDYNFNSNLNGHQIFYELSHYKSIKPTTIFVYVTGENALKTVKTILESGPDDYILKPFTQPAIKGRLRTIIKKKNSLMPIYERIEHNDFEQAITECDDLLTFFPQHNLTIRQLKSKSLISLKRYEEAKQEYQQLLKENSYDWIKTSLANVMILNDENEEAKNILEQVSDKKLNHLYHDEMSNVKAYENDVPAAIKHLKVATMLLEAGLDRELIIANLSISCDSYDEAFKYIKLYYTHNNNTFKVTDRTRLLYVQYFLYRCFSSNTLNNIDNALLTVKSEIDRLGRVESFSLQYDLVMSTIALLKQDLGESYRLLGHVMSKLDDGNFDFYDMYHLVFVLEQMSFINQLPEYVLKCKSLIDESMHPNIMRSQIHMQNSQERRLKDKIDRSEEIKRDIRKLSSNPANFSKIIDLFCQLHEIFPKSIEFCLFFVKFVAVNEKQYQGENSIHLMLNQCNRNLNELLSAEKIKKIGYEKIYRTALGNVNGYKKTA